MLESSQASNFDHQEKDTPKLTTESTESNPQATSNGIVQNLALKFNPFSQKQQGQYSGYKQFQFNSCV